MIPVTKTFFPPLEEYYQNLQRIWSNQWLTNRGELVKELEEKLKTYLKVPNMTLTTNGTLPLQIALKVLGKGGEIITTPFSYVATTSSIVWEKCTPVYVDIDPYYLTIDESKIENAITDKTTAILATHVFGNACNVAKIKKIADKHNLKVIYDGAHGFAVKYKGHSLLSYGNITTCSFHATKIFQTGEGGAIFCNEKELAHEVFYSHNFGHNGPNDFSGVGINAKMSELQAAMGLSMFPYMEDIISARKKIVNHYDQRINNNGLSRMKIREGVEWNYSYYPLIFENEDQLLEIQTKLNKNGIFPRRYFYPSLNNLSYVEAPKMYHSEAVAERILCLPLYTSLSEREVERISDIINSCF